MKNLAILLALGFALAACNTVHGFGQDSNGELYAMVTNTASNGTGGIVYKLTVVPEPATAVLAIAAVGWLLSKRRRLPH